MREAAATVAKLHKKGHAIDPIAIDGRAIATTFWGKAWCRHLESLSDFQNRLPRGRTYVRRGAVVHLALEPGRILAKVQGSSLYEIEIGVAKLQPRRWSKVVSECTGSIDSLVELLRGRLSESVMRAVTNLESGLFPATSEIQMSCSCPDWAVLCKHLAAVLYGVGARLDARPELLFTLRGVDASELVAEGAAATAPGTKAGGNGARHTLSGDALGAVFGIELELTKPMQRNAVRPIAPPLLPKRASSKQRLEPRKSSSDTEAEPQTQRATGKRALVPKRRSTSDIAQTAALVLEFIDSHPGVGVESIAQHLGLGTGELSLPLKKLIATGSVVSAGLRRATKYSAASLPARRRRKPA
jgi:uncharacterized Zn finger protein